MRRSLSDTDQNEELAKVIASKQKNLGDMTLYFGCRRHDLDHIYKDELVKAKVFGALNEVHVAFSREPGKPKVRSYEWFVIVFVYALYDRVSVANKQILCMDTHYKM